MAGTIGKALIGTSGWTYKHWTGQFYPAGLAGRDYLSHYAESFSSVEVNATFYRMPKLETVDAWVAAVPEDFVFAIKASRFTTHRRKLKDPATSTNLFFPVVERFGAKRGPVLFQLPPRWRADVPRLRDFLAGIPRAYTYVFEFRDPSWFTDEVLDLLAGHGAAFCIYDLAGFQAPLELTAGFVYLRLHGPGGAYQGRYGEEGLAPWAERIEGWRGEGRDVYCYLDNDEKAYAVADARTLRRLTGA